MSRDARGQMLLVAGLALAVAFVALALVLNTVVFTENLATRNHDQTDDALGFEAGVEGGVGGLISEANRHNNSSYTSLDTALRANVATWDANATVLAVADGSVTNTTVVGSENGTRIYQTEPQEFTDRSGSGDWVVAREVDQIRRFVVVATPGDGAVSVNVSDGTDTWLVEIADNGSDTTVTTYENDNPVVSYTHGDETVVVDLTEGMVNGTSVEDWTFARNVSTPYDVEFVNGTEASGRYQLFVDRLRGQLLDALPGDPNWNDDGSYPVASSAIYSADVNVTVRRSRLTYQTTLTVAPESGPWNETLAA